MATLLACALTLFFLNKLLWPLREAKTALGSYLATKKLPTLPLHYEDEAGILLKELQHTIEQLDYLIGEKKDVIAILSHDIRTPFNQVLGLAGMILLETDKAAINQHALTMKEISIKNLMVLNDILTLLKTDYAEDSDNTAIEINELTKLAVHHLSISARAKSIVINVELTNPIYLTVNKILLTEAITNVINNAIKFSYPGSKIDISIQKHNDQVLIRITDYGLGVSAEDQARIFKRFTNAGKSGTSGEHSSGVGLYLSRKIITKSKGNITVESDGPGKGSTFTISLPLDGAPVK